MMMQHVIRDLIKNKLSLHSITVDVDSGQAEWLEGVNIRGHEGCDCCGDEFASDQYFEGEHRGQVGAIYSKLVIDARDPEQCDVAEPEIQALCDHCRDEWIDEIKNLGLDPDDVIPARQIKKIGNP